MPEIGIFRVVFVFARHFPRAENFLPPARRNENVSDFNSIFELPENYRPPSWIWVRAYDLSQFFENGFL